MHHEYRNTIQEDGDFGLGIINQRRGEVDARGEAGGSELLAILSSHPFYSVSTRSS